MRLSETLNVGYRKRFSRGRANASAVEKANQSNPKQPSASHGKITAVEKVITEILLSMNNPTELARRQTAAEKNRFLAEKEDTFRPTAS